MPLTLRTAFDKASGLIPNNEILLSDFTRAQGNFNTSIRHITNNGPLPLVGHRLDMMVLNGLLQATPGSNAITFYHGLRDGSLYTGTRATTITGDKIEPELDTPAGEYPTHMLIDGGPLMPLSSNEWVPFKQQYYAEVEVDRADAGFAPLDPSLDPKCITFPWSEIDTLVTKMTARLGLGERATPVLGHFAWFYREEYGVRVFNGPHGIRHSYCIYMRKLNGDGSLGPDMLNDHDLVLPTSEHGINFGHMCPPKCKKTSTKGTP